MKPETNQEISEDLRVAGGITLPLSLKQRIIHKLVKQSDPAIDQQINTNLNQYFNN